MDYEATDKDIMFKTLVAQGLCPNCRNNLQPVAFFEDVWACDSDKCSHCFETFYLPDYQKLFQKLPHEA